MISSQKETRRIIKKAIKLVKEILVPTFGPNGRNVIIVKNGIAHCSNDGATIIKNIKTNYEDVNAIIEIISDSALATDDDAGDGTTSTALIACEMLTIALKKKILNIHYFIQGIKECCNDAILLLDSFGKKNLNEDDYYRIALQATNDETLANIIFDGFKTINFSGQMFTNETNRQQTFLEVLNNFTTPGTLHSIFFTNDDNICIDYPSVILIDCIIDDKIILSNITQFITDATLLIVDNITNEIINDIILLNKNREKPIIAISSGELGVQRAHLYKDLEVLCGCEVVHQQDKISEENIGKLEKIIIGNKISLLPLHNNKKRIDEYLLSLNNAIKNMKDDYQIYLYKMRISRLDSNVAIIHVGGATNQEIQYKRYKLEDGINALLHCKEEGVVEGGGKTLKKISMILKRKQISYKKGDYKNGRKCFLDAILVLFKVLEYNRGISSNKRDGKASILDPTFVVKAVIKNATSIASLLIETSTMVQIDNNFDEFEKFK